MALRDVKLDDKYDLSQRRVFVTGFQALVRLCLMQKELDRRNGLNTAGYVTGYRGSPLGGLDSQFLRAASFLEQNDIRFRGGLNEDLAATAIWGSQQAELRGEGKFDGVFGMWYGKGPGVDRTGDVFRHANFAGSSKNGGVRSIFTAARLLEILGRPSEAEILFGEALAGDLEQGFDKHILLDLLYIFAFHVRSGRPERGAELCLETLAEIERQDTVLHGQLRAVFLRLIELARGEGLGDRIVEEVAEYLRAHWRYPAPAAPEFIATSAAPQSRGSAEVTGEHALVASLLARALWCRIRRTPRANQQATVATLAECHTHAFADLLLAELRAAASRNEAEFIASLSLRAAAGLGDFAAGDFLAEVWTEVANVRRLAAEWHLTRTALRKAEEQLARGSGAPLIRGRRLSVEASLSADQGQIAEALAILAECRALYEKERAWPLVGRTLVQIAHLHVDHDPAHALSLVKKALPMIPADDPVLRWLAESVRTESLIEMRETSEALQAFQVVESLRLRHARGDAGRRSNFTAARLLEALGHLQEAEQLFEAAIAEAFEREIYREAFLDILYLFGLHIRHGATEKAVALCRMAIERLDLFGVGHEQLRAVWTELGEAATEQVIRGETLAEVRRFLTVHWKTPAARLPKITSPPDRGV